MHDNYTPHHDQYEVLKTRVHFTPTFTQDERDWLMEQLREMVKEDVAFLFQTIMESRDS
jgi:hypothetical protein